MSTERTIYDCGKIKMNPNDRLLLVSLNKSFDDAKANEVYRRISVYEKTHRYWAIAKSRASQINYIEGVYHGIVRISSTCLEAALNCLFEG